jgi:hypothetical protein
MKKILASLGVLFFCQNNWAHESLKIKIINHSNLWPLYINDLSSTCTKDPNWSPSNCIKDKVYFDKSTNYPNYISPIENGESLEINAFPDPYLKEKETYTQTIHIRANNCIFELDVIVGKNDIQILSQASPIIQNMSNGNKASCVGENISPTSEEFRFVTVPFVD